MSAPGNVSVETEAKDLEKHLQIVKYRETNFKFPLVLKEVFSWFLVRGVLETNTGCNDSIGQSDKNNHDMVDRALEESETKCWGKSSVPIFMDCH